MNYVPIRECMGYTYIRQNNMGIKYTIHYRLIRECESIFAK